MAIGLGPAEMGALDLPADAQIDIGRARPGSLDLSGDDPRLQLRQGPDAADGLNQADEIERAVPGMKDVQIERDFRRLGEIDQCGVEEGEAHLVTRGGDDRVELLAAAVGEESGIALEPADVGPRMHAPVADGIEQFRVQCRMRLQRFVVGRREPVASVRPLHRPQHVFSHLLT